MEIGAAVLVLGAGVWIIGFGLPAAWLAAERGRSFTVWLLVGLFLGPVAVLVVGLAPIRAGGPRVACVECLEPVRPGAARCPHCGWDLLAEREKTRLSS